MRLICPNCDAQYEVPLEVIPEGGRDVQCSNCGHTWFQNHPDQEVATADDLSGAPEAEETWEPEPEPEMEAAEVAEEPAPAARRRELDPEVAEVLREEAERERRQRQAEAEAFEMQQDLGLTEPDEDEQARRAREARAHMANIRGEDLAPEDNEVSEETYAEPDPQPRRRRNRPVSEAAVAGRAAAEAATVAAESRKELLPDVEEINQTLRASSEPRVTDSNDGRVSVGDSDKPAKSGGGFARGFFLIVVLMAVALAIYVFAPQISASVPQAAPAMDGYVSWVDGLRIALDEQVTGLMQSLDGMSSETAPEAENSE
nr:zinc-ribbon domain-containing protein [Pacificoceanicola onchidii]